MLYALFPFKVEEKHPELHLLALPSLFMETALGTVMDLNGEKWREKGDASKSNGDKQLFSTLELQN